MNLKFKFVAVYENGSDKVWYWTCRFKVKIKMLEKEIFSSVVAFMKCRTNVYLWRWALPVRLYLRLKTF